MPRAPIVGSPHPRGRHSPHAASIALLVPLVMCSLIACAALQPSTWATNDTNDGDEPPRLSTLMRDYDGLLQRLEGANDTVDGPMTAALLRGFDEATAWNRQRQSNERPMQPGLTPTPTADGGVAAQQPGPSAPPVPPAFVTRLQALLDANPVDVELASVLYSLCAGWDYCDRRPAAEILRRHDPDNALGYDDLVITALVGSTSGATPPQTFSPRPGDPPEHDPWAVTAALVAMSRATRFDVYPLALEVRVTRAIAAARRPARFVSRSTVSPTRSLPARAARERRSAPPEPSTADLGDGMLALGTTTMTRIRGMTRACHAQVLALYPERREACLRILTLMTRSDSNMIRAHAYGLVRPDARPALDPEAPEVKAALEERRVRDWRALQHIDLLGQSSRFGVGKIVRASWNAATTSRSEQDRTAAVLKAFNRPINPPPDWTEPSADSTATR